MAQEKNQLQMASLGLFALCLVATLLALAPWAICSKGLLAGAETMALCGEDHPMRQSGIPVVVALFALFGGLVTRQLSTVQVRREALKEAMVKRAADRSQSFTPLHLRTNADASTELAIELDEELDLGVVSSNHEALVAAEGDSLMAYVEAEKGRQAKRKIDDEATEKAEDTVDGFYCPPGMETASILYVDPTHEGLGVEDDSRINNPDQPYGDLAEALKHASRLVRESGERIQVRLMPGVYQTSVDIPDRIVVLNHRMPAEGTVRQRMRWLEEQDTIDHPERVTLLPPQDQEYGVRFSPGRLQGIFGVHLVGREGVKQAGIKASGNTALAVLHSSIEGFSRGAFIMSECGEELTGRQAHIVGCRFRGNTSLRPGAALNVQKSVLFVEDCTFDSNTATLGGAIFAKDLKAPMVMTDCTLLRNRALTRRNLSEPLLGLKLVEWQNQEGLGGAIAIDRSRLKIVDSRFDGNDASLGGGAIAVLGGSVVLQRGEGQGVEFHQNRATVGGALLTVGWIGAKSQIKSQESLFQSNIARTFGGGIAAVGLAALQIENGQISMNGCQGKDGIGAGIGLFRGARALLDNVAISENRARVHGGGIGAINGSVKIVGKITISGNEAEGGKGGAVYAITGHDAEMDSLITQPDMDLPFSLVIEEATIEHNMSSGPGAGVYAGNNLPHSSFPFRVHLGRPEAIWNNRSKSDTPHSAELVVSWSHETKADSRDKVGVELLLQ